MKTQLSITWDQFTSLIKQENRIIAFVLSGIDKMGTVRTASEHIYIRDNSIDISEYVSISKEFNSLIQLDTNHLILKAQIWDKEPSGIEQEAYDWNNCTFVTTERMQRAETYKLVPIKVQIYQPMLFLL